MSIQFNIGFQRGLGLSVAVLTTAAAFTGASWVIDLVFGPTSFEDRVMTDPKTGCQYIHRTGPTPRLDANGKIICVRPPS